MKVAVFNLKGGVGKTRIAINLALSYPDFGLITNDFYTDLEKFLEPDSFIKVRPTEKFPEISPEHSCVYDLGGYVDNRLAKLLTTCDQVIIPTLFDINDFRLTVRAIKEVEPFAKKILVVLNQAKKEDVPTFMDTFGPLGHPMFRVRKSNALADMLLEQRSVAALANEGGLRGYHYKGVAGDFERLFAGLGLAPVELERTEEPVTLEAV